MFIKITVSSNHTAEMLAIMYIQRMCQVKYVGGKAVLSLCPNIPRVTLNTRFLRKNT